MVGFMMSSSRFIKSSKREKATQEIDKRRGKSKTYTEPLASSNDTEQSDIDSFMAEFYSQTIFEKSTEMRRLLAEHPDTLGTHYKLLVPAIVSFDQFWSRYYYRCSLTTVLEEHSKEESGQENVKNIFSFNGKKAQQSLRREIEEGLNVSKTTITRSGKKKKRNKTNLNSSGLGEFFDDDIVETIAEEEDEIAFAFAASG